MSEGSRFPKFYEHGVGERLALLRERGVLSAEDWARLAPGRDLLTAADADRMIENVIGVFGLPMGLGLNFLVNGRSYVVPMVVEEPSIVAAVSAAAKIVAGAGGFRVTSTEPLLLGQVQVVDVPHLTKARNRVLQNKKEILDLANSLHPKMVARGGGAKDVEVVLHPSASSRGDMLVVHLVVDTRDAMGANLVNSMCEGVAALVESLTEGRVFLRILSNLSDRAMVRAEATIPPAALAGRRHSGEDVRDGIILANDFAAVDPYRAATHNKGVMNGIDAVALATGNDWRAIEAAVHAYAARGHAYTSLTRWYEDDCGNLVGSLEIPLKVGTVGGPMQSNPTVQIAQRILNVNSARELAEVMGAVGLAQNLAALRALSTDGIQRGHMTLHARSCVAAAGATDDVFDTVVERLIESGEIKVWKAREILAGIVGGSPATANEPAAPKLVRSQPAATELVAGHGKVILLGEHAAVYGAHVIAAPIPLAIQARCEARRDGGVRLLIPRWGIEESIGDTEPHGTVQRSLHLVLERLGVRDRNMLIEVFPHVPRAMGLGGSAAMAVAIIRAVARAYELTLGEPEVNALAYACECIAHGTPSGIDNTLATFGRFIIFRRGDPPEVRELRPKKPLPLVIGMSGVEGLTAATVAKVRSAWERNKPLYDGIFAEIDRLTLDAAGAIEAHELPRLGELMNVGQGLLNALGVSSWELEELIEIARKHGALGAKLTGGGGGGSMVALCPDDDPEVQTRIAEAMRHAGYRALVTGIGE